MVSHAAQPKATVLPRAPARGRDAGVEGRGGLSVAGGKKMLDNLELFKKSL